MRKGTADPRNQRFASGGDYELVEDEPAPPPPVAAEPIGRGRGATMPAWMQTLKADVGKDLRRKERKRARKEAKKRRKKEKKAKKKAKKKALRPCLHQYAVDAPLTRPCPRRRRRRRSPRSAIATRPTRSRPRRRRATPTPTSFVIIVRMLLPFRDAPEPVVRRRGIGRVPVARGDAVAEAVGPVAEEGAALL